MILDIDELLENADWPKRTPDRMADLKSPLRALEARAAPASHIFLLDPNASDAELQRFAADLAAEQRHLSGQHDQKTHGHGTISPNAMGDLVPSRHKQQDRSLLKTDDSTRMGNLPAGQQEAIRAKLREQFPGMTQADLEANIRTQLDAGLANPRAAAGARWYDEAGKQADEIAGSTGITREQAVGMIAGQSPQHEWGSNVATAKYTAEALKANKRIRLSPEDEAFVRSEVQKSSLLWADGKGRKGIDPGPVNGKRLSDLDPVLAASVIKTQAKRAGLQYPDDVTGELKGCTWSCGLAGVRSSIEIYRGGSPDDVLAGHKVRSFYNNINAGTGNSGGSVTIDTHAVSAALGQKVTAQDPRMDAIMHTPSNRDYGAEGVYPMIADAYRTVAAEYGLAPDSAQAIVWLQWRETNP